MKELLKPNVVATTNEEVSAYCDFTCGALQCKCACNGIGGTGSNIETDEDILF